MVSVLSACSPYTCQCIVPYRCLCAGRVIASIGPLFVRRTISRLKRATRVSTIEHDDGATIPAPADIERQDQRTQGNTDAWVHACTHAQTPAVSVLWMQLVHMHAHMHARTQMRTRGHMPSGRHVLMNAQTKLHPSAHTRAHTSAHSRAHTSTQCQRLSKASSRLLSGLRGDLEVSQGVSLRRCECDSELMHVHIHTGVSATDNGRNGSNGDCSPKSDGKKAGNSVYMQDPAVADQQDIAASNPASAVADDLSSPQMFHTVTNHDRALDAIEPF